MTRIFEFSPLSPAWQQQPTGESEARKPQKMGGCGWTTCPENSLVSHVAQYTARVCFWACFTQITDIEATFNHFWAVSRTCRGARGQQRALVHGAIEAHVVCRNRLPSFGCSNWVLGPFWAKNSCFEAQNASFWGASPDLAPPPRGATGECFAQNLVWQGDHLGSRMARVE